MPKPKESIPKADADKPFILVTADQVISHLKEFAREQRLTGGSKQARDTVKIEMQGFLVDSMNLPTETKTILKTLFAKRMLIVDTRFMVQEIGKANVEPALTILKDLQEQIRTYPGVLAGLGISGEQLDAINESAEGRINFIEGATRAKEKLGPRQIGVVVTAKPGEMLAILIDSAETVNGILITHHIGGQAKVNELNTILVQVRGEYLDLEFPVNTSDLEKRFLGRTK
jgi:hypothetical protein